MMNVQTQPANKLAQDFLGFLDGVEFARTCGITPDDKQAALLRSLSRRIIGCTSRQWGKSTTAALIGASDAWYDRMHPEARKVLGSNSHSLTLIVSPTQRQSDEAFSKLRTYLAAKIEDASETEVRCEGNPEVFQRIPGNCRVDKSQAVKNWQIRSLTLTNGARVVSLPGAPETIRGYSSVTRAIIDEAAFVDPALIGAIRPMLLVSRGSLLLLSTPNGKQGEFYEIFTGDSPDWERIEVPYWENPRINIADLDVDRRELPAWLFEQEYECKFRERLGAAFKETEIQGALVDGEELVL